MAARKALTIAPSDIDASDRLLPLDEATAQDLAVSMAMHDAVFNPIGLRQTPRGEKTWALVHGRHRLRAFEINGVSELTEGIHFNRLGIGADQARMVEIEENMARKDHSAFARAVMITAYRAANGSWMGGRGGDRKSADFQKLGASFTARVAEAFDLSADQVERLLRIGTALAKPKGLAERLHFSKIARNQSQLLKLSALPEEQLTRAAEAFDAAKGDYYGMMSILERPVDAQDDVLAKLKAGVTLADTLVPPPAQAPAFDHWQQAVSAFSQLDFKGRVSAVEHYWKHDEKALRAGLKALGFDLVKTGGGQ